MSRGQVGVGGYNRPVEHNRGYMWVTLRFKEKVAQLGPSDSAQGQGEGQGGAPLTEILSIKWNECIWDMVDAQDVEWGVCVCGACMCVCRMQRQVCEQKSVLVSRSINADSCDRWDSG